jgi:TolB-like protein
MATLRQGDRLGPFEVLGALGAGGMGEVYRARDTRLGRQVAVKVLPEAASADPERLKRFDREARAASSLNHPNLLTVYELDRHDGVPYLVTELLDGETVRERLRSGALTPAAAVEVALGVARGLAAAHEHGVVHRDLKPENLFLVRGGAVKILDFGLARLLAPVDSAAETGDLATVASATELGSMLGTVGYMAPEQVRGVPADARADIFSFGVVLYELLTARRAFSRATSVETLTAILKEEPPPLEPGRAPPALERIVKRCLAKDPAARFQSAQDLLFALEGALGEPRAASGESAPAVAAERRSRVTPWLLVAAAALVGVTVVVLARWPRTASPAADTPAATAVEPQLSIAVLPFAASGLEESARYLGRAIPDEIVTELTYAHALAVRPFSAASAIDPERADLAATARTLAARRLVTGRIEPSAAALAVSVEVVDTDANRLVWRARVEAPRDDLLALRRNVTASVRSGLLPALGERAGDGTKAPENGAAYAAYLRALGAGDDDASNREAIGWLDQSVELEPGFAPAWLELARRLRHDGIIYRGGDVASRRAIAAAERAIALDADLAPAQAVRIRVLAERGRIAEAYRAARALVERRPRDGSAHAALAYALRYGGELDAAIAECALAGRLDRASVPLGCAWPYFQQGDVASARRYLASREGWPDAFLYDSFRAETEKRAGDYAGARALLSGSYGDVLGFELTIACLERRPPDAIARLLAAERVQLAATPDGEIQYWLGAILADCRQPDAAVEFLGRAVASGYCAATGLERDPLIRPLAADPRFPELLRAARACRERFRAEAGLAD